MSFGSFVHAVDVDIVKVWHLIEGSPAVQEIEKVALAAVANELRMVADKFLGENTPADKSVDDLIDELSAKIISLLPKQP